ncbi:ABC transporter substrate-binding protein [Amylibacter marinus]|uniref:ABC transporter substrate-binding protein n=2 Tax=Amylibacter marinus TaxID=1475483 RepID=A0ABQ5VSN9_9RHOB|nr:ABC transporter substrate-binding protein [Amylibacter marinus]
MYGDPALPSDFTSLPYANADAPKGGKIIFGEKGGFDSMNPYILKGKAPWGVRAHTVESLLMRSYDEPFTLYGLLAESVETGPNREWVEFTLRKEAQFSDGSPVTVEDVLWSFETLGTQGHPRYQSAWQKIKTAEKTADRSVRFTFNVVDFEAPLIMGLRPILRKADWEGRVFEDSSLDVVTGSGPYVVSGFEPNRFIEFSRNPDYWGKDLAVNAGRHNADTLRYEYFRDGNVLFEAFKAGDTSWHREGNAGKWAELYDFPAVQRGDVVKSIVPHARPSGMKGFVFNTRKDKFADWRVRDALIHAFNYEFIVRNRNSVDAPRSSSYFSNSVLGMSHDAAQGAVLELLEPYRDQLIPGAIEGYSLPVSDGSEANRKNLRVAMKQLAAAGWTIQEGVLKNEAGEVFEIEVLLKVGGTVGGIETEGVFNIYADALKRLGINTRITLVDSAAYNERRKAYDFDMIYNFWYLSLSPGNEQTLYWGANGITTPGTRNYMGMNSPAAEAMVEKMLTADSAEHSVAATKALDRILTSGRYVVPLWYSEVSRLAHKKELNFPDRLPMYGDWSGFLPDVWWLEQ